MVASRDISPGEVVVVESSVCWGPNHTPDLVCLECLVQVTPGQVCDKCGYPLCDDHGGDTPNHALECEVFTRAGYKLGHDDLEDMEIHYPCVEIIRCLSLREKSVDIKRLVDMLMDHREERMAEKEKYIEPYKDNVIRRLIDDLGIGDEEEIIKVLGYLDVNSIAVRGIVIELIIQAIFLIINNVGADGPYRGRGIYPVASLMNHSCICNTRNIITGSMLESRATVPISAGSPITTHYVSPLLNISTRQQRLREKWFFDCKCERCCSPTDNGAYTSALQCQGCETGYLVPQNSHGYSCDTCKVNISDQEAELKVKMWEPLVEALGTFKSTGTQEKEALMNQLLLNFHPNHSMVIEMKLEVANKLCRDDNGILDNATTDDLKKKKKVCEDILGVMNIIYPGLSKYRGLLLHELADTNLSLAAKLFNHQEISKTEFNENLKLCKDFLDEGIYCLKHDRVGSFESGVCHKMRKMKDSCQDFETFISFL